MNPKVLLPSNSPKWTNQKLYATLTHELAHLKRHDPLTRMLSFITRAFLWFHPLIWIAHRQLIQAQEESCDLAALASGISAADYADEILSSATQSTHTPQGAISMAQWSQIGKRINHIINQLTNNTITMKKILTILSVTTATACIIATTGLAQETLTPPPTLTTEPKPAVDKEQATPKAVAAVRSLLLEAKGYLKVNKAKQAHTLYSKVLEIDPDNKGSVTICL